MKIHFALLNYFGFWPLFYRHSKTPLDPVRRSHIDCAILLSLLFQIVLIAGIAFELFIAFLIVNQGATPFEQLVENLASVALIAAMSVLFAISTLAFISALRKRLPFPRFLAAAKLAPAVKTVVCILQVLWIALLLAFVGFCLDGARIESVNERLPKTYLVYDDMYGLPEPVLCGIFYPILRASEARYGPGSIALRKLSPETLTEAFSCGVFVFVASHGDTGVIQTHKTALTWNPMTPTVIPSTLVVKYFTGYSYTNLPDAARRRNLKFVYLTACRAETLDQNWKSALAPATVITFRRDSAMLEHFFWTWTQASETIRGLKE